MSDRQIALAKALQEIEPEVYDLARMARLVANYAGEWFADEGDITLYREDAEALLFGIFQISGMARSLRAKYQAAFKNAPEA
ncbi:hypothetical protein [Bosea sp. (in: a-proteobacteria)]|uniref:hypothetical protein n=1 Tax=Bosea sp. (in: a-proteobacteria) TaxID=1871050 RepID=UPI001AD19C11|nr:hypothetical protein [Bosea sp. (in: a-proteobacteria)]MBN9440598.1 hypothetical protein [Bosea sp. (in: a-proteobacteria)]